MARSIVKRVLRAWVRTQVRGIAVKACGDEEGNREGGKDGKDK